jgi:hypothetical protein
VSRIVKASSFADPVDVRAFKRCKERGGSDNDCFKVGDNGIGAWGDDTSEGSGPSVALPPEHLAEQFGTWQKGHLKKVEVTRKDKSVIALIKDRMPHLANIHNGARMDMNPDTCSALGLKPPVMTQVSYRFVDDD